MRGSAIILAGVLLALAIVPGADAEGPAEVYFFDGDDCKAQVYILPDTAIGSWRIPGLPGWADRWIDEDGNKVTADSTFGPGGHIVKAYKGDPAPAEKPHSSGMIPAWAGVAGAFAFVLLIGAAAVWYYRRQ